MLSCDNFYFKTYSKSMYISIIKCPSCDTFQTALMKNYILFIMSMNKHSAPPPSPLTATYCVLIMKQLLYDFRLELKI